MAINKIKTIADLKFDINIESFLDFNSFKEWLDFDIDIDDSVNKIFLSNKDRKIKKEIYTFIIHLIDNNKYTRHVTNEKYSNEEDDSLFKSCQLTEEFKITINLDCSLEYFIYLVCIEINKKLEKYNDWHIFLEGFKRINDFKYEIKLGS